MVQLITILLVVISIIVTFFAPIWGWGILGVPTLFLLWQVLFARFSRPRKFPELSEKANELLSRYAHFYLWSLGCRDMSASAITLAIGGIVVAIINGFQGFYWGIFIGIANFGIQNYFSYTFVPDALIRAKGLQEEHLEIVDYLDQVRAANQESMGETDSAEDQPNEPVSEEQDHDAATFCPQCGATYVISEGVCSDCGVPLERLQATWNTSHGTDEKDETSCPASIDVERTEKYKGASCDHDLWDRFIGRGNSDEVLEEKAEYIAPILVHASIASTDKLAESDQESDSLLIEEDSKMSCTWEFLALHIHYLDRITFNSLGATKRDIFIDKLVPCVVLSLVKDGRYGPKDDFPRALLEGERSLVKLVNLRQVEYAVYDRIMADSDNLAGSLMWEAARSISEALGYKDDAYAIFQVYAVFTNYLIAYKFHKLIEMS